MFLETVIHLSIVPDDVAHHVGPVRLVDHQPVDPVVVGLVVLEPHAAVLIGVGVPRHVDPGPVDDVGLGLGPIIRPRVIIRVHAAFIEEGNKVSVVINFISLQKYFGPEELKSHVCVNCVKVVLSILTPRRCQCLWPQR